MRQKTKALGFLFALVLALAGGFTPARPASAASLVEVTNFGSNPSNLPMYE